MKMPGGRAGAVAAPPVCIARKVDPNDLSVAS
jgi:hypothetical protein